MGACDFSDTGRGKTAREAFQQAVEEATYNYGHAGYTGTIAEINSFIMVPLKADESIEDWDERQMDNDNLSKWGPCACCQDPGDPQLWHFAGWASS